MAMFSADSSERVIKVLENCKLCRTFLPHEDFNDLGRREETVWYQNNAIKPWLCLA
jgi:hypothetical protein